jgi:hypothetical protein
MMPVNTPKVLVRPQGQRQYEWVDLWEAYVSMSADKYTLFTATARTLPCQSMLPAVHNVRNYVFMKRTLALVKVLLVPRLHSLLNPHPQHSAPSAMLVHPPSDYVSLACPVLHDSRLQTMQKVVFIREAITEDVANNMIALTLWVQ